MPASSFARTAQWFNGVVALALSGFCLLTVLSVRGQLGAGTVWICSAAAVVMGTFGGVVLRATHRGVLFPRIRWWGSVGLLFALTVIRLSFFFGRFGYGGVLKDAFTWEIYFLLIISSAFYGDRRLTLVMGAGAAGLHAATLVVGVAAFGLTPTTSAEANVDASLVRWNIEVLRCGLLVAAALLLNVILGYLHHLVDEVQRSEEQARSVLDAATRLQPRIAGLIAPITDTALRFADRATTQASASRQIGATAASLAQGFAGTATNAAEARQLAARTRADSEESSRRLGAVRQSFQSATERVDQVQQAIEVLLRAVDDTDQINATIRDIADSLRYLSLNASLEAAKAGDQGHGFAVVAEETRRLVEQTGRDLARSRALLESIRGQVGTISTQAGETATQFRVAFEDLSTTTSLIDSVAATITANAAQVDAIASVTDRQASEVQQVSTALADLDRSAAALHDASATLLDGVSRIADAHRELQQVLGQDAP